MKYTLAKRLYNTAESAAKKANNRCFIDRAIKIEEILECLYGEGMADEILESVFENEIEDEGEPGAWEGGFADNH